LNLCQFFRGSEGPQSAAPKGAPEEARGGRSAGSDSVVDRDDEQFLYRNVGPGEKVERGSWSDAEKAVFLARLKGFPVDDSNWGPFSTSIAGRAGYQCKRFYAALLASGEVGAHAGSPETSPVESAAPDPAPCAVK